MPLLRRARGFSVRCKRVEDVPAVDFPLADVYYWWPRDAVANEHWLWAVERALQFWRRRATVFIGFDSQSRRDMDWLPLIASRYNASVSRLFFDEGGTIDTGAVTSPVYARATHKIHASVKYRYRDRLGHWGVFLVAHIELGHRSPKSLPRNQLSYRPSPPPLEQTLAASKLAASRAQVNSESRWSESWAPRVEFSDHLLLRVPSRELHQQQCTSLRALAAFEQLCRSLGITYTLCGGSAIGAMQWASMLPWDDDVDVILPRADFSKLARNVSDGIEHRSAADKVYDEGPMTWAVLPMHLVSDDEGVRGGARLCLPGSGRFEMGWPNERSAATSSTFMRLLKLRETQSGSAICTRALDPFGFSFGTVDIITTTDVAEHRDLVESLSYDLAAPIEQCAGSDANDARPAAERNVRKCAPVAMLFGGVPTRMLPRAAIVQHLDMAYPRWRRRVDARAWQSPLTIRAPRFAHGPGARNVESGPQQRRARNPWGEGADNRSAHGTALRRGATACLEKKLIRWEDRQQTRRPPRIY